MASRRKTPAPEADVGPVPTAHPGQPHGAPRSRTLAFAAQELRLISALVLLIAIGLFLWLAARLRREDAQRGIPR